MAGADRDGPPRAVLIAAVVVGVLAAAAVLAVAAHRGAAPLVPVPAVRAPQADEPDCKSLLAAVPDRLGDYRRAEVAFPAPPGAAAWRGAAGSEPVILRCGVDRPTDFVVGSPLQMVDEVSWFRVADPAGRLVTWYAVDRPVYVALTLPQGSGPTPIQDLSGVIAETMPTTPVDPAPPR